MGNKNKLFNSIYGNLWFPHLFNIFKKSQKFFSKGLRDSAVVHLIHTGEQQLSKSSSPFETDADLEAIIKRAQNVPISTAFPDPSFLENGHDDNIALNRNELIQPR